MERAYNIIDIEQDSDAWHEFRKMKIGASRAAPIMNQSKWDTPLSLFEKMTQNIETPCNPAMQRGKLEEPRARQWASNHLGYDFQPQVLQWKNNERIIASLDGFCITKEGIFGLEVKTPSREQHLQLIEGIVPIEYDWQMQHQMLVSGALFWFYCSWDGYEGILKQVMRDDAKIDALLKAELKFIQCLDSNRAPEPCEKDWLNYTDDSAEMLAIEFTTLSKKYKDCKERMDSIKEQLKSVIPHPRTRIGDLLRIQKICSEGRVDYGKIPELQGVNLEPYRKSPVISWRFD